MNEQQKPELSPVNIYRFYQNKLETTDVRKNESGTLAHEWIAEMVPATYDHFAIQDTKKEDIGIMDNNMSCLDLDEFKDLSGKDEAEYFNYLVYATSLRRYTQSKIMLLHNISERQDGRFDGRYQPLSKRDMPKNIKESARTYDFMIK